MQFLADVRSCNAPTSVLRCEPLTDAFRSANGNPNTANHIWDYVKNYSRNAGTGTGGNAHYEGTMYRASVAARRDRSSSWQ